MCINHIHGIILLFDRLRSVNIPTTMSRKHANTHVRYSIFYVPTSIKEGHGVKKERGMDFSHFLRLTFRQKSKSRLRNNKIIRCMMCGCQKITQVQDCLSPIERRTRLECVSITVKEKNLSATLFFSMFSESEIGRDLYKLSI